jgi:hexulose-6-phosphate isomerase
MATAAIASTALGQGEPKAPEPKKRPLKKAVNLGMAKGAKDASTLDRFRMIKDAGFDGIEINRPDALPLDELLKARDATGLEVAGLICTSHWGKPRVSWTRLRVRGSAGTSILET